MRDLLFIHIPKNAGTSISDVLRLNSVKDYAGHNDSTTNISEWKNEDSAIFGHSHIPSMIKEGVVSEEWYYKAYKFCFVRNPYTRAVSLHNYLTSMGIIKKMSFVQFMEDVVLSGVPPIDHHHQGGLSMCNSQCSWIPEDIDFVGKFENIHKDWNHIKTVCSLSGDLPHKLNSNFKYNLTPNEKSLVVKAYWDDFEKLPYLP